MATLPQQRIVEVEDGITAILHDDGEAGASNSTFIVDDGEAFVVDTLLLPELARTLLEAITARNAHPSTVINTHHHIDHVGGNAVFGDARLISDPLVVEHVERMIEAEPPFGRLIPPYGDLVVTRELVVPKPYHESDVDVPRDGRLLTFGPAHTPRDIVVWLPGSRTLLAGDLLSKHVVPLALHGDIGGWIEAIDTLLALEPATVVPGHGPVGTADDLRTLRTYLQSVLDAARRAVAEGAGVDAAMELVDLTPVAGWHQQPRTRLNMQAAIASVAGVKLPRPW